MQKFFLLVLVAAGAFVWLTSVDLPPVVASHFGPGGAANGFMDKNTYTVLMLALVVGVPALVASSAQLVRVLPPQLINLPNRQYWLAPERRAATLEALASLTLRFAVALAVFLCFVHWLVIRANAVQPPRLPETWLFVGLAVFGAATLAWLVMLFRRFRRVP
jgi:uncharacterized membrane protein